jgi:hypothetical protein
MRHTGEGEGKMLFWLIIAIALAIFGVLEIVLNFTIPFVELRTILLFLLIMGMSYRIYLMEKGGEKEDLKNKVRELEDKLRELEMEKE